MNFINVTEIRSLIHIVTRRTGSPVHDEDLEQEIALNAVEAFQRLDRVEHPRALLMKIVYDTVRDHWRRRPPSSEDLAALDERLLSHCPSFEVDIDSRRRLDLIHRALKRLPSSKRALLELFYIQDHSIPEIAVLQGKSISAIKMELSRSRRTLARIVHGFNGLKSVESEQSVAKKSAKFASK